ncbi:hypothetical protein NV379_02005 [Paenibacillus sp. N1-5-1-14]|uniref:hypothetical protein n=1 Tax=Paenibacillus radicibacter TaxID=2972488 RepID=UPI00215942D3|nr:hypothetical protein [Paenibacillus radicibacter]MCR8641419.1 hypothetical protein [Paenibacillus radicibacter]
MSLAPLETKDDIRLVKDFMMLPIVMDVLEADIDSMHKSNLKMPKIYTKALKAAQNKILVDVSDVKKLLRVNGIKIYDQRRTNLGLEADYMCRGYHHKTSLLWSIVKSDVQERLCKYMSIDITQES